MTKHFYKKNNLFNLKLNFFHKLKKYKLKKLKYAIFGDLLILPK